MRPLPLPQHALEPWLFSFDFDGTLFCPWHTPPVDRHLFEQIVSLRQSLGVLWGINTGRSFLHAMEGMAQAQLPFFPDFLIVREREIFYPNDYGRWVEDRQWNKASKKAHKKLFSRKKRLLTAWKKWVEEHTSAQWGGQIGEQEGIVATSEEEMASIVAHFLQDSPQGSDLSYQRNGVYLRFSHGDYHKGSALVEVAKRFSIPLERRLAMGDGHNDMDMLSPHVAGLRATPSNGHDDLKAYLEHTGGEVEEREGSHAIIACINRHFFKL